MRTFKVYSEAVAVAFLQVLVLFPFFIIVSVIVDMWNWRTFNVWNVFKFNVKAAVHTIVWQWNEIVK